ncbi:hypothetical protein ACW4TU_03820 [Streptomyces sp. QTS52]
MATIEGVTVHHPLQTRHAATEIAPHFRQRHVDDHGIEGDGEETEQSGGQGQSGAGRARLLNSAERRRRRRGEHPGSPEKYDVRSRPRIPSSSRSRARLQPPIERLALGQQAAQGTGAESVIHAVPCQKSVSLAGTRLMRLSYGGAARSRLLYPTAAAGRGTLAAARMRVAQPVRIAVEAGQCLYHGRGQ